MASISIIGCQKNLKATKQPASSLEMEKEAIRKVIDMETTSYYKQDFETWKSTYVNEPYFRYHGYWEGFPQKVVYYNGFDSLRQIKKKQFDENRTVWQQSRIERRNENFRIYGEVAWYTFEEVTYDTTTNRLLGTCMGARLMEKHNGTWKIAYLGFHFLPIHEDVAPLISDKK
jgi:hypothetical protein